MAQPFKHPTSGMYYLRRRVPDELHSILGKEYKRTLKTRDATEAKLRFAAAWMKCEEAFSIARAQLTGAVSLSARDIQQLAARWYSAELNRIETSGDFRRELLPGTLWSVETPYGAEEHQEWLTVRQAIEQGDDTNWFAHVSPFVVRALKSENIPLPSEESDQFKQLVQAFYNHLLHLSDTAKRREQGDWSTTAPVMEFAPLSISKRGTVESITLLGLFDAYSTAKLLDDNESRSTKKTLDEFRTTIRRFVELFGDQPITSITRAVVQEFRAQLALFPTKTSGAGKLNAAQLITKAADENLPRLSPQTIRNKLRALSAVLGYALRMDWIKENPVEASGIARAAGKVASQKAGRRRRDYTEAELRAIFTSPVFSTEGWQSPRRDFGKASYWLPLLMYYTGARREELAQLASLDIFEDATGIACLSILATPGDQDNGRTVKTLGSRRVIPLHSDLVSFGLVDYAKNLPEGSQLFPALKPNPSGYYGVNWGKAWAEYLRRVVGLNSTVSPSHGFRHTFKTLCRQVGISEDVHDAITGHTNGGVGRDYGSMPLSRIAEELKKFPACPLSAT